MLLDSFAGVQQDDRATLLVTARHAAAAVPNASVAVLVAGRHPDPTLVRQAGSAFPVGIRVVAIQAKTGAKIAVHSIGNVVMVTVGSLSDLPAALRRVKAS